MLGVFVFFGSANPLVKDLTTWAPLYSIAFISISFQSSTAGLFIRLEYFKSIFMIDSFAFGVSYLIIGLFLLFLTNEPLYLFIPIVAQLGIKALALEFLFFKAADLIPDKDASSCDFKIVSELVTMASRLIHVSSIHLDKILVGIYLGSADLGIYRMAFQIVSAPNILISKFIEQYALSKIAKRKHTTIDGGVIPFSINKYLSAVVTLSFVLLSIFAVASYSGLFDALLTSEWAVLPDILVLMSPLIALRASIKINELIYRTHITEKNYLYYCIANLLGIIGCIVIAAPAGLSWFSVSIVAFNLVFFIFGAIGIKRLLP
jgi:O-antigen/teichoic acid export membrane protein